MKSIVGHGIALGILVELWTAVVLAAGWYKDPTLTILFFLVVPLQVTILILALKESAPRTSYAKQVLNGTLISLIGGMIVVAGSVLLTTVFFPHAGITYNPWSSAFQGFIGTMATGIVTSLVASILLRRKGASAAA